MSSTAGERYDSITVEGRDVPLILNSVKGARYGVILAHGAGGDSSSGNLPSYAQAFFSSGYACLRFYVSAPKLELRTQCMQAAVKYAVERLGWHKYILAGHSMGGRVACEVAAQMPDDKCLGLILFSYPLHAPKKTEELRLKPVEDLSLPILFVHGTRDDSAEQQQWDAFFKKASDAEQGKKGEVYTVEGGDHGLKVKGGAKAAVAALDGIVTAVAAYAKKLAGGEAPEPDTSADVPELPGETVLAEPAEEEYQEEEEEEEEVIELAVDDEEFELSEDDEEEEEEDDEEDTDDEFGRSRGHPGHGGGHHHHHSGHHGGHHGGHGGGGSGNGRKRKMMPVYGHGGGHSSRTPPHKMHKYRQDDY